MEYTHEGIRYLRGQSVTELGLDLAKDSKFIANSEHKRMIRAEVVEGDVLYTIAGSIGNACVVRGVKKANINQAIVRIKPGRQVLGQYLCDFLNSPIGKLQSRRIANGGVQLNINFTEVKALKVLLPELDVQEQFVDQLNEARRAYKTALKNADDLLNSIDSYLLSELGIILPPEPENTISNRIFTAQRSVVEQRIDPAFFSHKFSRITKVLLDVPHILLRDVVQFSVEQWDQINGYCGEFQYLEISAINTITGDVEKIESIPVSEAPSRARMLIRDEDILVSTTRPSRGAIAFIRKKNEKPLIASTGFAVIRDVSDSKISKEFLFILLRSQLCLMQFEQRSSGGNYPAITQAELGRVLLPSVALPIQIKIVERVCAMKEEAKRMRKEAENELDAAKRYIEAILLGEVTI